MTTGIRNVVGVPVEGTDFFDREDERRTIWRALETGHVLLPSPRRVGKTSLMRTLATEAEEQGFVAAIYVDVAGAQDEREFAAKLVEAIAATPAAARAARGLRRGALARLLGRVQSISAGAFGVGLREAREGTWKELGASCLDALRAHPGRVLVLCDELGIFVQTLIRREGSAVRARAFLTWLRDDARQGGRAADRGEVHWLVASSVGLPTLTDLHAIGDTINDFALVPIGPFAPDVADRFLAELAHGRGVELSPEVRARVLERVGWPIPYFLQVFFAALCEPGGGIGLDDVDETFERLLGHGYRTYFDWWSQRLPEELGRARADHARAVLTACARSPEGVRADTLRALLAERSADDWSRASLFDVLESDGYWTKEGARYRFRSNLLREYWLRRHGP